MGSPGQVRLAAAAERPAGAGHPMAGEELVARLRALTADTGAPEDALEPALRVTLEALGVGAGALCVFDPRHELLWLAGEVGLSDEGCRQLRNVRRGAPLAWDMPLHGLLNRRAYLIDSAARNRYVPPLVEPITSMRTIACLPLYADVTPVGSLILIALAPQTLREQDIRNLTQPTRELVAMIEAVRKRASATRSGGSAPAAGTPAARPVPAAARSVPAPPAGAGRRGDPEEAARLQALTVAVSRAEQERDRLAAQLEAAATERAAVTRAQAAIEARLVEATSELEWMRLHLADAEAAAAKAHERACDAERERERAGVALDAVTARERALQGELEATLARSAATTDESRTEREADEARAQHERGRQDWERTRERLEQELGEAHARDQQSHARVAEVEAELAALRLECAALQASAAIAAREEDEGADVREEPAASVAPEPAAPVTIAAGQPAMVVIDGDPAWEQAGGDHTVVHLSPADAAAQVAALRPSHVVVNLAAPGAFAALTELRAAGVNAPLFACLADPAANRAIPLGRVEPARRPLDPDAVLAALGDTVGRNTKVVTVGTDVDALMSLRQIFTRQGLGVSMAWDAKQAAELLGMIRPALVVIDLEQPPRVGAGIVARLAGADPIPTMVLISSGEKDPAPAFRTALADAAHNHRAVTIGRVLTLMGNRTGS